MTLWLPLMPSQECFQVSSKQTHCSNADGEPHMTGLMWEFVIQKNVISELIIAEPGYRSRLDEIERVDRHMREADFARRQNELELQDRWRSIHGNDDQMLLTWAAHIWPNDAQWSNEFVKFAVWLTTASPDDYHSVVQNWNWDYGIVPLLWIIRNSDCELGTALQAYFRAEPHVEDLAERRREWIKTNYSVDLETFDFRMEIRARIARGEFRSNTLAFDFSKEVAVEYQHSESALSQILPEGCALKQAGRVVRERTWGNGLPPFNLS